MADRKTWVKRVAAWRASGMSCREYAEREGLGPWRTLRYWAWRIERERRARKTKLVRVVREAETVVVGAPSDELELRIVISSSTVRLELARNDLAKALEGLVSAALVSASSKGAT
ncbi:MAG: hypothetical protein U0271_48745 [Polyangiaceae bacterium]